MSSANTRILPVLGVLLIAACGRQPPATEQDYDVYHYGNLTSVSPAHVVRLDNNHEILSACREPSSREALARRGIRVTESQVEMLVLMELLDRQGELLGTSIPVLDRDTTARMRDLTLGAASSVADATQSAVLGFRKELETRGQVSSTYPLLFAYILDGKVWERLNDQGLLRHETKNPFWSGEVWSVAPSRGVHPGTITYWHDQAVMYVIWTEASAALMTPFMVDDGQLRELVAACVDEGRVESRTLIEQFSSYGLVSATGECTFPVFAEGDALYEAGDTLARQVADQVVSHLDLEELVREFGFRDESQALVIAYHEMMWDLVDALTRAGAITKPALLADPSVADEKSVGDLVFVVRRSR